MEATPVVTPEVTFDFDFYRFTGKGERPTLVPTPHQAHFMRSRYSVDQQLVDAAMGRVMKWSHERGIAVNAKAPYPSNRPGKVWLEFRFGGLSL